jgi:hypothetical protein
MWIVPWKHVAPIGAPTQPGVPGVVSNSTCTDQRGERSVPVLDLIERLEPNEAAAIWCRQETVVCLPLADLPLKNFADELVGEVTSPEALHERKRRHPLGKGDFDGPIAVTLAICHGGRDLEQQGDYSCLVGKWLLKRAWRSKPLIRASVCSARLPK